MSAFTVYLRTKLFSPAPQQQRGKEIKYSSFKSVRAERGIELYDIFCFICSNDSDTVLTINQIVTAIEFLAALHLRFPL